MGDSRLTRRTLLRSAVVVAGGAGVAAALPGVALADGVGPRRRRRPARSAPMPPVSWARS